jgi:selenocysteine lyase/cysteine desulfurase
MKDIDEVRQYFLIMNEKVFLNHAGVSPICTPVAEAIRDYLKRRTMGEQADSDEESAKRLFARLINAKPEEIALVPNTSTGLSIVANLLRYPRGSNIVTSDLEFPSVVYPWLMVKTRSDLEVRYVRNIEGHLPIEDFEKAVDDQTVAVVISHVEYANGFRNDLGGIAEVTHEHGTLLVVDACQSAGALDIDIKRQGIDYLATSCYKWLLGPSGAGFLYLKEDLIEEAEPVFVGWASVDQKIFRTVDLWDNRRIVLSRTASRFEIGTLSAPSFVGAAAALRLILDYGIERIENRILGLTDYLLNRLGEEGFSIQTPNEPNSRSGIVNFRVPEPQKTVSELQRRGVIVSARMNGIRVSPHFYNTREDIEGFLTRLKESLKGLRGQKPKL